MQGLFQLSKEVLVRYRALQFDPDAQRLYCWIPFGTIFWPDEHPDGKPPVGIDEASRDAIFCLVAARTYLWHHGGLMAEMMPLWEEARTIIPDWPGFRRLKLSTEDKQAAEACEAEIEEIFTSPDVRGVELQKKPYGCEFSLTLDLTDDKSGA